MPNGTCELASGTLREDLMSSDASALSATNHSRVCPIPERFVSDVDSLTSWLVAVRADDGRRPARG